MGSNAGTIPDLDVFLSPFLTEIQGLVVHRAFSHSITFAVLLAPLLGWLVHKYVYKEKWATLREWQWLSFWALFTHPLLDCFTNWGTQLFNPFSNYRVAFNTISVVDPIYTVPFGICLLVALFLQRESSWRKTWNQTGLVLSTLIMGLTCVNKVSSHTAFKNMLRKQGSSSTNISTYALPLNLLWFAVAEENLGYQVGLYSVVGDQNDIQFRYVPKNRKLVEKLEGDTHLETLNWFSKGQWTVTKKNDTLYWHDLRFGLQNLDMSDTVTKYNFTYQLVTNQEKNKILEVKQIQPPVE
ncbi:MAG: metal-dependent hydrolase, partial [Bacteroidia bacterium]